MRKERVVVLVQTHISAERQQAHVVQYAADHRYAITSVTGDGQSALALVQADLADVVLVDIETAGTVELGGLVHDAGGRLEAVHRGRRPSTVNWAANRVREASDRGVDPQTISLVLGLPLGEVLATLRGTTGPRVPQRTNGRSGHR